MIRVTIDRVTVEGLGLSEKEVRARLQTAFESLPGAGTNHPAATEALESEIARIVREAFDGQ